MEIDPPVPEKKIFEGFLPYMGVVAIDHVTSIMSSKFHFLVLKAFIQNLVQNGTVVSEKFQFEFLYVHNLGPSQEMTLTFNTLISSYIELDICSY